MRCSALVRNSKHLRLERHHVASSLNKLLEPAVPSASSTQSRAAYCNLLTLPMCRCDEGGHCTDVCKRGSVQVDEWLQHSIQTQVCPSQCCNYWLRALHPA